MAANFVINATGSGNTTLIPAPPGPRQFIRVLHYHLTSDRPVTVQLLSSVSSGLLDICYATNASGGGIATPEYPTGVFDLPNGEGLVINVSTTGNVGGSGKYTIMGQAPQQ